MRTVNAVLQGGVLGMLAAVAIGGGVSGVAYVTSKRDVYAVDPSQKARTLALSISEGMNASALAALVTVPALMIAMVVRSRGRRA